MQPRVEVLVANQGQFVVVSFHQVPASLFRQKILGFGGVDPGGGAAHIALHHAGHACALQGQADRVGGNKVVEVIEHGLLGRLLPEQLSCGQRGDSDGQHPRKDHLRVIA